MTSTQLPLYTSSALMHGLGISMPPPPAITAAGGFAIRTNHQSPDPDRVCVDGERTEHLKRLAGMWIARNIRLSDVKMLCHFWNTKNAPPLDESKVDEVCDGIWATDQRNNPQRHEANCSQAHVPLFNPSDASIDILLSTSPPAQRWLLDQVLPLGKVAALIAGGGTGKSQFALQLAIAVATGTPLADAWDIGESGEAVLILAEDDQSEVHRRFARTLSEIRRRNIGIPTQALKDNLKILCRVAENNLMTAERGGKAIAATEYVDRLILGLNNFSNLKLVVIDPVARFRGGDENSAEDATRFIEQAERIAKATGATVLLLHHVNKGSYSSGEQSQGAARGSSAFTDGVRFVMNLTRPTSSALKKLALTPALAIEVLEAGITKNNYGAPRPPVYLTRGNGGYLSNLSGQSSAQSIEARIHKLLQAEATVRRTYSINSFEARFGGVANKLGIGVQALRKVLKTMLQNGELSRLGNYLISNAQLGPNLPHASLHAPLTTSTAAGAAPSVPGVRRSTVRQSRTPTRRTKTP